MRVSRSIWLFMILAGIVFWSVGCSSTSPVLLQLPSERAGTAEIPLKVGIVDAEKAGEQRISNISTCQMCGFYQFRARMPRRNELNYVTKSVGDYFRDTKTFSYTYDEPFDRNDVQLVINMEFKDLKIDNTALGTFIHHSGYIPVVNYVTLLWQIVGLPVESFRMTYDIEMTVRTSTGREVARYTKSGFGRDRVNLYKQPFNNYLWYDSVFQKEFFSAMDYFVSQMRNDRAKLMQAVAM